jgi:hypothetical protein
VPDLGLVFLPCFLRNHSNTLQGQATKAIFGTTMHILTETYLASTFWTICGVEEGVATKKPEREAPAFNEDWIGLFLADHALKERGLEQTGEVIVCGVESDEEFACTGADIRTRKSNFLRVVSGGLLVEDGGI